MNLQMKGNAVIETNSSFYAERQEWSGEHPNAWHEPPALSLDERGMIQNCSKSCEGLFGYRRHELVWHPISSLFPQLTGVALVQEGRFNPALNFLCRCGKLFQGQNVQGDTFTSTLSFVRLEYDGRPTLRLIVSPSDTATS